MKTENKAAHTPGPWMIVDGKVLDSEGKSVATPFGRLEHVENALLIAAAPELLELAKYIAKAEMPFQFREALFTAKSIIAKAEGLPHE